MSGSSGFQGDDDRANGARPIDMSRCLRCGEPIESLGEVELRTGGSTGATHFFLGQWAELGEGKLPVSIYGCGSCGHLEMRTAR